MLLVLGTIVVVPLWLPVVLPRLSVDGGAMAWTLGRQMLLPMLAGGLLAWLVPAGSRRLQFWVPRIGSLALYVVLISTVAGFITEMPAIIRSGALSSSNRSTKSPSRFVI
jgi:BASS family bile acid:Na+ symporter